jgi:hypothetical protein
MPEQPSYGIRECECEGSDDQCQVCDGSGVVDDNADDTNGVRATDATLPRELLQAARDNLRVLAMHGPGVPALVTQLDAALGVKGIDDAKP